MLAGTVWIADICAATFRAAVKSRSTSSAGTSASILTADLVFTLRLADFITSPKGGTDEILEALAAATTTAIGAAVLTLAKWLTNTQSVGTGHLEGAVAAATTTAVITTLLAIAFRLTVEDADKLIGTLVVSGTERTTAAAAIIPTFFATAVRFARGSQIDFDISVYVERWDVIHDILGGRKAGQLQTSGGTVFYNHPDPAVLLRHLTSQQCLESTVFILPALLLPGILTNFSLLG